MSGSPRFTKGTSSADVFQMNAAGNDSSGSEDRNPSLVSLSKSNSSNSGSLVKPNTLRASQDARKNSTNKAISPNASVTSVDIANLKRQPSILDYQQSLRTSSNLQRRATGGQSNVQIFVSAADESNSGGKVVSRSTVQADFQIADDLVNREAGLGEMAAEIMFDDRLRRKALMRKGYTYEPRSCFKRAIRLA